MVTATTGRYVDMSDRYLRRAREYLAEGDLVQASEKGGARPQCWSRPAPRRGDSSMTSIVTCGGR